MYDTIVPWLRCITCHGALYLSAVAEANASGEVVAGTLACAAGHAWPVERGVLVFSREDAPSDPWSKSYAAYERYCAAQETAIPEEADAVAPIVAAVDVRPGEAILDVCTGQGTLLFSLLRRLDPGVEVVSLDMSPTVQWHNRRYLLERYGARRVSFASCDAAHMAFRDGVFRQGIAHGMANMLDKMALGVREVARVLRPGGTFAFDHMYVAEDSEGWRALSAHMREAGAADYAFLGIERAFLAMMDGAGFRTVGVHVLREVLGDPDRDVEGGPLFPYPNESVTELLVRAVK